MKKMVIIFSPPDSFADKLQKAKQLRILNGEFFAFFIDFVIVIAYNKIDASSSA